MAPVFLHEQHCLASSDGVRLRDVESSGCTPRCALSGKDVFPSLSRNTILVERDGRLHFSTFNYERLAIPKNSNDVST